MLSGSPVAAVALTLLNEGTLTATETYLMITGSCLGASLFVLLVGSFYILRGVDPLRGLTIGVLPIIVVASIRLPAIAIGYLLIRRGLLDRVAFQVAPFDVLDRLSQPFVECVCDLLPEAGVFLFGVGMILLAFRMFDIGLPRPSFEVHRILPPTPGDDCHRVLGDNACAVGLGFAWLSRPADDARVDPAGESEFST